MGIPSFFSYIVKNHGSIIKKISKSQKIDNLYLDSNSIIYDSFHSIKKEYNGNDEYFEKLLIQKVCEKIEYYINEINPINRVIIAYDGVAPVAKMEQQRTRRYKSMLERTLKKVIYPTKSDKEEWKTTAITPGTNFMEKLNKLTKEYFKNNEKRYGLNEIIISGSDKVGEGEHKIFEYIRNKKSHKDECSFIYGLDADLIMLGLNHLPVSKHIYLYRETPEFIKSINSDLNPNESYVLDIPLLSQAIISTMNNGRIVNNKQQSNRLYDYIFLCFFLGNDFMPHFPAINIRTKGIEVMINAYKKILGNTNNNLTNGTKIYWNNVYDLISELADNEWNNIVHTYKVRDRQSKRQFKEAEERYLNAPLIDREEEIYIAPFIPNWEDRYYKTLFDSEGTPDYIKKVSINYLEGLEWVMKYYTTGCCDWNWHYKYPYPPLLKDLIKYVPKWQIEFITENEHKPVTPYTQLAYVLPKDSLKFLPTKIYNQLIYKKGKNYPENCKLKWAYCKYIWEAHVDLPEIDINELQDFILKIDLKIK
jgi:5'-3' exonuclease|uniref:Xrn1 N-terminal domain-containing protein n=1 Tax=viral metagenome TaxID=1070528 RepID=A0A6C0IQY3_9ZZZZ